MLTSIQTALVVVGIVFSILATCAVILRVWARTLRQYPLGSDDWLTILGLLFVFVDNYVVVYGVYHSGFGDPQDKIEGSVAVAFGKTIFVKTITWEVSLATVKISILLLYRRIFLTRKFRLAVHILIGITLAWMVANVIAFVLAWDPVDAAWTRNGHPATNFPVWLLVTGVVSLTLDITTLCCPLVVIRKLTMDRKKKYLISSVFLLGSVALVASLVQLHYYVQYFNAYRNLPTDKASALQLGIIPTILLWMVIEVDMGLIAACLPTYASLLGDHGIDSMIHRARAFASLGSTISSRLGSRGSSRPGSSSEKRASEASNKRSAWLWAQKSGSNHLTTIEHDQSAKSLNEETPGIMVSQDFSVTIER